MFPIFVIGCERSGTTLIGNMLGSKRSSVAVPESQFLDKLLIASENDMISTVYAKKILENNDRFKIWNIQIPKFQKTRMVHIRDYVFELVKLYAKKNEKEMDYWVDHTPGHIRNLSRIKKIFPDAKFVHIIRDGRAVASSILSLPDWPFGSIYGVAKHWMTRVGMGLAAESAFKNNAIRVHYENLILDTVGTLTILCKSMNINYEENMLYRNGIRIPEYTKNQHKLVNCQINFNRISAWKYNLSIQDIRTFEGICGDMLPYLGYKLCYPHNPKEQRRIKEVLAILVDSFYAVRSKIRRKRKLLHSIHTQRNK